MQIRKYCIYHPQEILTNFCRDKKCLLPLCPACIGEHSEYHQQQSSSPCYSHLSQTFMEVQTSLRTGLYALQQDKERNNQLLLRIENLPQLVHDYIAMTKKSVYETIEKSFENLERELTHSLKALHEEIGIFCLDQVYKYERLIVDQLESLREISEALDTDKCLANVIYFLKDKHKEVNSLHTKLATFLHSNEAYHPSIETNHEALQSLSTLLSRILKVDNQHTKQLTQRPSDKDNQPKIYQIKEHQRQHSKQPQSASTARPKTRNLHIGNSPYRQKRIKPILQDQSSRNYRHQYEQLNRRVSQVKRDNEALSRRF